MQGIVRTDAMTRTTRADPVLCTPHEVRMQTLNWYGKREHPVRWSDHKRRREWTDIEPSAAEMVRNILRLTRLTGTSPLTPAQIMREPRLPM